MALAPGARLGCYEILSAIGAGGMGEVYRARDTKLKRDVALKVLPDEFTSDADRIARFQREAEVVASLNHPHIAQIHGIQESDGVRALVLELVEGPTLAERINDGRVPIDEACTIARQIADALEAAHDRGVVHRDLKPSNVKLRPDGTVKVLDFGLAKALREDGPNPVLSNSPTISNVATRAGVLVGTVAYMSPEQARGLAVDARTDIWAFGCVLYEMLAGKPAFNGPTLTDVLSHIVSHEPAWQALPPQTPEAVGRLLRRCFQKDARRRLRHIGDARLELEEPSAAPPTSERTRRLPLFLTTVGISFLSLALGFAGARLWPSARTPLETMTFTVSPPAGTTEDLEPIVAPDGRRLAFVAPDGSGRRSIWLRTFSAAESQPVAGTEDVLSGSRLFWSPDSRTLGYFTTGRLKRIEVARGTIQNIAPIEAALGATWSDGGVIVFAPHNRVPLHRVAASGGSPEVITELSLERRENSHRWPSFLPDGRHFLYTARSDIKENTGIYVGSLDSSERKWLLPAQSNAQYAASYLLFVRDGTLMAQPFDAQMRELSGEPAALVDGVAQASTSAGAAFSISADGSVLTYARASRSAAQLTWFDRSGQKLQTIGPELDLQSVRLAPDDRRIAVVVPDMDSGNRDIWVVDSTSGTMTRLVSNPATDWQPTWSPDSESIAFASDRNGASMLFLKKADANASEETLLTASPSGGRFPDDWSWDGRFIVFHQDVPRDIVAPDLWVLPLNGDRTPFPLVETRFRELDARLSPNGRWVAYVSNASGRDEVYIKAFEQPDTRPAGSGTSPVWRRDGRELFFLAADGQVMALPVEDRDRLTTGPAKPLFRLCPSRSVATRGTLNVAADGQRFLAACRSSLATSPSMTVIVNWSEELKARVPTR